MRLLRAKVTKVFWFFFSKKNILSYFAWERIAVAQNELFDAFRLQAQWCELLGSPFTAKLLGALLDDPQPAGALLDIIGGWPGDPSADVLALRVAGALHALVLTGQAPAMAAVYPPNVADAGGELGRILGQVLVEHRAYITGFLKSPPQTNEVARAGVLLGGFLTAAATTGLPLRLLEIGASAGLNLLWDQFHYRLGDATWGNPASPVHLAPAWEGNLPPLGAPIAVAARHACDISPIDVKDPQQALRLRAYVWADQTERLVRLEAAMLLARSTNVLPEQSNATDFLQRHLADAHPGEATIIYQTIMWNYVADADKATITETIHDTARRATAAAPLGWLRFDLESKDSFPSLALTLWPDGTTTRLATANPHGASVAWLV
jgi:hypothetical protein